jgi:hypothetical protein
VSSLEVQENSVKNTEILPFSDIQDDSIKDNEIVPYSKFQEE